MNKNLKKENKEDIKKLIQLFKKDNWNIVSNDYITKDFTDVTLTISFSSFLLHYISKCESIEEVWTKCTLGVTQHEDLKTINILDTTKFVSKELKDTFEIIKHYPFEDELFTNGFIVDIKVEHNELLYEFYMNIDYPNGVEQNKFA